MSTVIVSVDAEKVTIEGAKGGTFTADLEGGSWSGGLADKAGSVVLMALARADVEPTVRHYTANGQEDFPEGWTFTDDEPAKTVIETVGEAHLIG